MNFLIQICLLNFFLDFCAELYFHRKFPCSTVLKARREFNMRLKYATVIFVQK